MAKKKQRRKPKPKQQAQMDNREIHIPFPGLIKFFLGNKKRISVTGIAGVIISVSVAWPIVLSWAKSTRNGMETVMTLNTHTKIESVKKKQVEIMTAHGLMNQSINHIRDSQSNLQSQQHQMWSDVRALRGMEMPPTPVPIPTFVPTVVMGPDGP